MGRKRKAKPKWQPWEEGGRGRPPVFQGGKDESKAIELIQKLGISGAADKLGVSRPTLSKLAHKAGLEVRRGRRVA